MLTFVQKIAQRVKDRDDKSSCTSSCHAARVECLPSAASPPDGVKKPKSSKSLFPTILPLRKVQHSRIDLCGRSRPVKTHSNSCM